MGLPDLPPRVGQQGQRRTVGKIKVGDREIPGRLSSGEYDRWADLAYERFVQVGFADGPAEYLAYHVESRVVAMMIELGQRSAEITINNVPCGLQTRPRVATNDWSLCCRPVTNCEY